MLSLLCAQFCLSHHFSVNVPSDALLPESRGRKAQGSRIDNGAVSALYREKKKADHTLHEHVSRVPALQCVRLYESMSVPTRGLSDMLDALTG